MEKLIYGRIKKHLSQRIKHNGQIKTNGKLYCELLSPKIKKYSDQYYYPSTITSCKTRIHAEDVSKPSFLQREVAVTITTYIFTNLNGKFYEVPKIVYEAQMKGELSILLEPYKK